MRNYRKPGNLISHTHTGTVAAGGVVTLNGCIAIATSGGDSGDDDELIVHGSVYLAAVSAEDWSPLAPLFWNGSALTAVPGGTFAGYAAGAKAAGASIAWVEISRSPEIALASAPLDKLDATAAPTVDNDVDQGYSVGSRWIWGNQIWICKSAADGAAVWDQVPRHNLAASGSPTVDNDVDEGYSVGSLWFWGSALWVCKGATDGAANWELVPRHNSGAAAAPGVTNDLSEGYGIGSTWVFNGQIYNCMTEADDGAAVWLRDPRTVLEASTLPTVDSDVDGGFAAGDEWKVGAHGRGYLCTDNSDGAAIWTPEPEAFKPADDETGDGTTVDFDDGETTTQSAQIPANTLVEGDLVVIQSFARVTTNLTGGTPVLTHRNKIGSEELSTEEFDAVTAGSRSENWAEFIVEDASTPTAAVCRNLTGGDATPTFNLDLTGAITIASTLEVSGGATAGDAVGDHLRFKVEPAAIRP